MSVELIRSIRRDLDNGSQRKRKHMRAITAERTFDACQVSFKRRDLYEQHVRRRDRYGFCLGTPPPGGLRR